MAWPKRGPELFNVIDSDGRTVRVTREEIDSGLRACVVCGMPKPFTEYRKNSKNNIYTLCKKCHSAKSVAAYARFREELNGIKREAGCILCGHSIPEACDFHHVDPSNKSFTIGRDIMSRGRDRVLAEVEKCVVICSNCHRLVNVGLRSLDDIEGGVALAHH